MSKIAEQRFERLLRQLLAERNAAKATKGGQARPEPTSRAEKPTAPRPLQDSFESGPEPAKR